MSIHGVLGETSSYSKVYDPKILYPIARSLGRDEIYKKSGVTADALSVGVDWWHCFELSWLDPRGVSQVAMARLAIPADSEFIIESKSLKLYLNSLNFTEFASVKQIQQTIENDLSNALQTSVTAAIFSLQDATALPIAPVAGKNIDKALDNTLDTVNNNTTSQKLAILDDVDASMLRLVDIEPKESVDDVGGISGVNADNADSLDSEVQSYHSHLLRSNCPVTNQPDWGTVQIDIVLDRDTGKESKPQTIDEASLLEYILTYRQHNGFHEQCVEQIFADLTKAFSPKQLMVRAWYTRRGGIDINPCRVSSMEIMPQPSRLLRQ